MPDFQATIHWTPPDLTPQDMQEIELFLKDEQTGQFPAQADASSPLGHDTSSYPFDVLQERDYRAKVYSLVNSVRGAPLVIDFTTPANPIPTATGGSVTYAPLQ